MGTAANAQCVILFGSHARGEAGENSDVEVISLKLPAVPIERDGKCARFCGSKEYSPRKALVVCNEMEERVHGRIRIMPYRNFLRDLWEGKIIR